MTLGQRYGTILLNLDTNKSVDLQADRKAATLAQWLTDHPGIELIARDRVGAFALRLRQVAPVAHQVADRWHLLRNCSETLLNVLECGHRVVREIGKSLASQASPYRNRNLETLLPRKALRLQTERQHNGRAVFDQVMELCRLGWSQLAIKRELGPYLK